MSTGSARWIGGVASVALLVCGLTVGPLAHSQPPPERLDTWRVRVVPANGPLVDEAIGWNRGQFPVGNGWSCEYSAVESERLSRAIWFSRRLECRLGEATTRAAAECRAELREGRWELWPSQSTLWLGRGDVQPTRVDLTCGTVYPRYQDSDRADPPPEL